VAALDISRLGRIDWDFPRAGNVKGSVQSIHWFPGNFITQIPSALIQVLSEQRDLVFDPFAGSGTTGIEAMRLGRNALISDRMSISGLIGAAKVALLTRAIQHGVISKIHAALTFDHECRSNDVGSKGEGSDPVLFEWYSTDTLAQLRFLWKLIEDLPSPERTVLLAIFSDVLFQCASTGGSLTRTGKKRRHHWGWVADNVAPKKKLEHDAIALFRSRLALLPIQEFPSYDQLGSLSVVQQDARCLALKSNAVDLVVTSPPYVGMIDYVHANRLIYTWMGWPLRTERDAEIGARFRRMRKSALEDYLCDMREVRDEIERVLKPGCYCAMVLGQSQRFPGTAEKVFADFREVMDLRWGPIARNPSRRRVSERAAGEPVEYIVVFQKR
jgi:hypothetical protein